MQSDSALCEPSLKRFQFAWRTCINLFKMHYKSFRIIYMGTEYPPRPYFSLPQEQKAKIIMKLTNLRAKIIMVRIMLCVLLQRAVFCIVFGRIRWYFSTHKASIVCSLGSIHFTYARWGERGEGWWKRTGLGRRRSVRKLWLVDGLLRRLFTRKIEYNCMSKPFRKRSTVFSTFYVE